jgi:glycosyltransferase involved in cell wall biosynthesis
VDDGSTDQTLQVARSFASNQVVVTTKTNEGPAATRNKAFSLSQGDYIQWLDADDLLAPDKIARQVEALDRCEGRRTLLSGGWGQFFYRSSKATFIPSPLWKDLSPVDWLVVKMSHGCHMQTATWLVSRGITEAAGPWNPKLLTDDDGEYFCRAILASDNIVFIPEAKVFYRDVSNNRVSYIGRSNKKLEAQFLAIRLQIDHLLSFEDTVRTRAACVKYLQKYMFDLHPDRPDLVEQMRQLARELGGSLEYPQSSWKYVWIEKLFGWNMAKSAALRVPFWKTSCLRAWDKLMYSFESTPR